MAAIALLIESDEAYRAALGACLRLAGCTVEIVDDPAAALEFLARRTPDLVVWGRGAEPLADRLAMLDQLRACIEGSLVVVDADGQAARGDLEGGADYWLPKPFVPGTLVGTIRAALRPVRAPAATGDRHSETRGMVLDGPRRTLSYAGRMAAFTPQEWALLSILITRPNRFVDTDAMLALGWEGGDNPAEEIRTYIRRLRLKLDPLSVPCRLATHHGLGYCLVFDAA